MSFQIVHSLPDDVWDSFALQHPDGNIFHTREMFEVWKRTKGYRPELWAVLKNDILTTMMLPVHISLWDGLFKNLTTRTVGFGDILSVSDREKDLGFFIENYQKETKNTLFTELRFHSTARAQQSFLGNYGFRFLDHSNYLVDLSGSSEQIWRNVSKSTRRNIRKAWNRKEFVVEELVDSKKLDIWYALVKMSFERARVPLADISMFRAAFDILCPKGMVQFLLGRHETTYVAASASLLYKDAIYGWYRGFDRAFAKYIPNDLMVWYLLDWGAQHGYAVFNFGGAGDPNEGYGPRDFKAKFGGKFVNLGRSAYAHRPIVLAVSKAGYKLFRGFL